MDIWIYYPEAGISLVNDEYDEVMVATLAKLYPTVIYFFAELVPL